MRSETMPPLNPPRTLRRLMVAAALILAQASPAADAVDAPRFTVYAPPAGLADSAGEPSIGYNLKTHRAMYIGGSSPTLQVTFPEYLDPPQAMSCEAQWKDVTFITEDDALVPTLDPILFTDQNSGRTFVSQLALVTSRYAYTDDDGETWVPGQLGGPPTGAIDHQTVGSGPYPAAVPLGNELLNRNAAVYYCSHNGFGACQRSDDGGLTFGPGTLAYDGITDGCSQYHGHIKVAPDGTVYLPNAGCGDKQVVSVSENAGITWQLRPVTPSTEVTGAWDPSVAIGANNTAYFCRADRDGHVRVAVSQDRGQTWSNDFDIGAAFNIQNGAFPEATAGDDDRAACVFLGTTEPGNYEAADFAGVWYGYSATTYDGGKTWTTVNATPGDPVQREGGICISGTGCTGGNRNLLDFNEVTHDEKGRVLFAFADGCTGKCADFSGDNQFESVARIARQTRGKTLYAAFDAEMSALPEETACPVKQITQPPQASASPGRFGGALGLALLLPLLGAGLRRRTNHSFAS